MRPLLLGLAALLAAPAVSAQMTPARALGVNSALSTTLRYRLGVR